MSLTVNRMIAALREFHSAFGVTQAETPTLQSEQVRQLRVNLMTEEFEELTTGFKTGNRREILDGLCDSFYVVVGSMLSYGYVNSKKFPNIDVLLASTKPVFAYKWDIGKAEWDRIMSRFLALTNRPGDEVGTVVNIGLRITFEDMLIQLRHIAVFTGFLPVLADAFEEVHRSNMSKLCETQEEAERTVAAQERLGVPCRFEQCEINERRYYRVLRNSDAKVIKSVDYSVAELGKFLVGE